MLMEFGALYPLIVLAGFAFIGASIKYIDSAFDDNVFDKRKAYALAGACGICMGAFVAFDEYAAAIFIGIVASVALAKKIDNLAFTMGTAIVIMVPAVLTSSITLHGLPIALIAIAGIGDEYGNNIVDSGLLRNPLAAAFFKYRLNMEFMMGALVLIGIFPAIYWVGLISFDGAYHLVGSYAARAKYPLRNTVFSAV